MILANILAALAIGAASVPATVATERVITSPVILKDRVITVRADLVFEAPVRIDGVTFRLEGDGRVVLRQAHGSRIEDSAFTGGRLHQLLAIRTDGLTVEGTQFIGAGNEWELFAVVPGHPWEFVDGPENGFWFDPKAEKGGTNRLGHINPVTASRTALGDGTNRITLPIRAPLEATFPLRLADLNTWDVWGPGLDPDRSRFRVVGNTEDSVTLEIVPRWEGDQQVFRRGETYRWATWREDALIKGLRVVGCTFVGPGRLSGLSAYGVIAALIKGNTATGFFDYGLGLEHSKGSLMQDNVASGNQGGWNQIEFVGQLGTNYASGNRGVLADVAHGYRVRPPLSADEFRPGRNSSPEFRTIERSKLGGTNRRLPP